MDRKRVTHLTHTHTHRHTHTRTYWCYPNKNLIIGTLQHFSKYENNLYHKEKFHFEIVYDNFDR
jgi:hypothetical protein